MYNQSARVIRIFPEQLTGANFTGSSGTERGQDYTLLYVSDNNVT